jgi:hypothetical protein
MKSKATRRFWRLFHALPDEERAAARRAFKLFQKDPSDPELHFKQVVPSSNYWSIRFGDARRAIGVRIGADVE